MARANTARAPRVETKIELALNLNLGTGNLPLQEGGGVMDDHSASSWWALGDHCPEACPVATLAHGVARLRRG